MLYDGAIRFCEQARIGLEQRNYEQSYTGLSRAQKIISELTASLKHELAPDVCGKLAALYNFVYFKLVEANVHHEMKALDDALGILRYQRETWVLLLDKLGKTKAASVANKLDLPAPNARMEASISMQG
jgi:flagellar protein FliS